MTTRKHRSAPRRVTDKPLQREEVGLWMAASDDSSRVARQNFELGNYHVTAFYLHLAVEEALKAAIVALRGKEPTKTRNLKRLYLDVESEIGLSEEQKDFLGELTPVSQVARYIDLSVALPRDIYSRVLVERYLTMALPIIDTVKRRLQP